MAAIVDYGEPFVKAIYKLEGDRPLAFKCYETVEYVSRSVELAYTPNVETVANKLSKGSYTSKQRFLNHAKTCVDPVHSYYKRQLLSSMKAPLVAFKAARLFSPSKIQILKPTTEMIDTLSAFPFLKMKFLILSLSCLFTFHNVVMFQNLQIVWSGGKSMQLNYLHGRLLLSRHY